ncbi:HAD family phosphatase [Oscillospiraceae bacterium MB08-C2-2]|nr:HAD family phosphatase [Oscillospiraceae bacterium MB08-C2-2]
MHKPFAIFDMDGTLIDSMQLWRSLGQEYLESKGITEGLESIREEMRPLTMSESAALFVARFGLLVSPQAAADEMNHIMDAHYRKDIPLKPGVREHLERLRQAGVRMCVASATAQHLMEVCLQRLGVLSYFEFVLSCESMGTSKREPDIYLEAASRLGTLPSEMAVYEDALYAIETAKKANFYVVAVYDTEEDDHWDQICRLADETITFH